MASIEQEYTMDREQAVNPTKILMPEFYFLISKFLNNGPFAAVGQTLVEEIERQKMLPRRIDWMGHEHEQSYAELERKYPHIGPEYLLQICSRVSTLLEKEILPSVSGIISMLGAGKQSLLRTSQSIIEPKSLMYHSTRLNFMPMLESVNRKTTNNIVHVLMGRQSSGPIVRKQAISTNFYSKLVLLRRTLGHLSAVYCVLFDRSGKYILTGADDLLVKLWSAIDGRLLFTFRGASAEITDIAVNLENTLLAAGSLDRILRVWDLQTAGPIAVLQAHTGMITSVNFCPSRKGDLKYLVTTSTDGSVAFWQYSTSHGVKPSFASKPIQYHEKLRPGQAQMICAAFSPGGVFLAAGSADHHVRVYLMSEEGPKRILETEAHTDTVDSIQWAHSGLKFVSGSKDGMALVWHFESQQWKSMKLNMADRLPGSNPCEEDGRKLKVTMVSWDVTDNWIITAVNDFTIKVWNSKTGQLHRVMLGHTDELYVLESHPIDPHVLVSAGHDGQLFIWDIYEGKSITSFVNHIGQGHGSVFDAKWSPDGTMIAATDSHGDIIIYGFGSGHERLKLLPKELFFHTDYRPLVRDVNHYVMDEQTQIMPHLMPPPFLVDVDGNPYPPLLQKLVPGRENCTNEQLIPNISVGPMGAPVVDGLNVVSDLDRLIAALASRQDEANGGDRDNSVNDAINERVLSMSRANGNRVGLRRTGDVEGVRQSSGNWQRENNVKWIRRIYVKQMCYYQHQALRQSVYIAGQQEQAEYKREMRRRPLMINTSNVNSSLNRPNNRLRMRYRKAGQTNAPTPAYRTRAVREREHIDEEEEEEVEDDDPDIMPSASSDSDDSSDATAVEEDLMSESSGSDSASSDYSDWVANPQTGQALEPPKRSKRKPVQNRTYSPSSSDATRQNNNKPVDRKKMQLPENGEIPEAYRPPEWLSEVIPRKAPYYPQMGDEVVYFRQGHQRYLEAVDNKKVYKLGNNCEPWKHLDLRDHEVVKVIGIKYEIRPPRLCCLKLALISNNGTITGQSFTVKYHDMPDVLDFIVLKQTFDMAVNRLWTAGDRFRCMIDDCWWIGSIEERVALMPEFQNSLFMCFRTRWDNGEYEFMSPWDMEPVDEHRLPEDVGGAVPVLPEELRATLYQPKPEEWPRGDRDASCRRIISGLEQVMGLAIADPFLAPVDLNIYPQYAYVVEYPIDLTTIKARFENHFYRRITSAQFDVRYLATNAEKFNQSHSHIVKHARIITDLCLRIIKDHNEVDVRAVYHQLVDTYVTSNSEDDDAPCPSTSSGILNTTARRSKRLKSVVDWRIKCRELLEMMWLCDDSTPFREPVDTLEHPDYLQCIDTPMDLRTVKEDLFGGNYESLADFIKDMRLIFTNSRNYNTNKRSRIYSMTLRLSNLFEDHMKSITSSLRANGSRTVKKNSSTGTTVAAASAERNGRTSKMRTRRRKAAAAAASAGSSKQARDSDDDDDNDDDDEDDNVEVDDGDDDDDDDDNLPILPKSEQSARRRRPHAAVTSASAATAASTTTTNGIASSSSASMYTDPIPGPSTSSLNIPVTRKHASRSHSQEANSKTESSTSSSTSSGTSSDSADTSDSNGMPLSALGVSSKQRKKFVRNSDSEDSYKPNSRRKVLTKPKKKSRKKAAKSKELQKSTTKRATKSRLLTRKTDDDDDDDDDDANDEDYNVNSNIIGNINSNSRSSLSAVTPNKRYSARTKARHNASGSSNNSEDDPKEKKTKKSPRSAISDHSYHLQSAASTSSSQRRNAPAPAGSDSDHDVHRPTRRTVRKVMPWVNDDDDDDNDNDAAAAGATTEYIDNSLDGQMNETIPKPTTSQERYKKRKQNDSDYSPAELNTSQQRRSGGHHPPLRSSQNSQHSQEEDSDDDQVLSQLSNSSRIRSNARREVLHTATNGSTLRNRDVPIRHTATTATVTTTTTATTTSTNNSNRIGLNRLSQSVVQDHSYGEPGPSSIRHSTRRTLSRHQRNADELDFLCTDENDPLDVNPQPNISGRLRQRHLPGVSTQSSSSAATTTTTDGAGELTGNSLIRRTLSHNNNDDDDGGQNGNHHGNRNGNDDDNDDDDDLSDPDDDKPLRYVANSNYSRTVRAARRRGEPVTAYSDNEPTSSTASSSATAAASAASSSTVRSVRIQKRPYYNEESDESLTNNQITSPKRRHFAAADGSGGPVAAAAAAAANNNSNSVAGQSTSSTSSSSSRSIANNSNSHHSNPYNMRQHPPLQANDPNNAIDHQNDSDSEIPLSVSSRGRIRKITAKARGLFRD